MGIAAAAAVSIISVAGVTLVSTAGDNISLAVGFGTRTCIHSGRCASLFNAPSLYQEVLGVSYHPCRQRRQNRSMNTCQKMTARK
jgi:uncharacterized protein (DUF2345 family)